MAPSASQRSPSFLARTRAVTPPRRAPPPDQQRRHHPPAPRAAAAPRPPRPASASRWGPEAGPPPRRPRPWAAPPRLRGESRRNQRPGAATKASATGEGPWLGCWSRPSLAGSRPILPRAPWSLPARRRDRRARCQPEDPVWSWPWPPRPAPNPPHPGDLARSSFAGRASFGPSVSMWPEEAGIPARVPDALIGAPASPPRGTQGRQPHRRPRPAHHPQDGHRLGTAVEDGRLLANDPQSRERRWAVPGRAEEIRTPDPSAPLHAALHGYAQHHISRAQPGGGTRRGGARREAARGIAADKRVVSPSRRRTSRPQPG
jgi:hypothetical protein